MLYVIIALVIVLAYVIYINYKDHIAVEFCDYVDILKGLYTKKGLANVSKGVLKPLVESLINLLKHTGWLIVIILAPLSLGLACIAKVIVDVHTQRK